MIGVNKTFFNKTANSPVVYGSGYVTDPNIKLLLHFDTTTFIDYSLFQRLPSVGSAASLGNIGPVGGLNSLKGTKLYTDGLVFSASDDWDFTSSDASIEFFIKPASIDTSINIIGQREVLNDGNWAIYENINGSIHVGLGGGTDIGTNAGTLVKNFWYHVAITRTQSTGVVKIYINGVESASSASVVFNKSTSVLRICQGLSGVTLPLDGYISELRISKGVNQYASGVSTIPYIPFGYDSEPIDNKTILMMHFDNNTNDSSPTTKSITNTNITFDGSTKKFGYAGVFNGTNSYATVTYHNDFFLGTSNFTIDGWFFFNGAPSSPQVLVSKWQGTPTGGLNYLFLFQTSGGNRLSFYYGTSGADQNEAISYAWTPSSATWYHLACVRHGNSIYLYINGSKVATGTLISLIANKTSVPIKIGADDANNNLFKGSMDELRFSTVARWTGATFTVPNLMPYFAPKTILTKETPVQFRHIRFNMTASNQTWSYVGQVAYYNGSTQISPTNMTDDGSPSPYRVTASSSFEGDANWRKYFAFDAYQGSSPVNNMGWNTNPSAAATLTIDLGALNTITKYRIYSTSHNWCPNSWQILGSVTGAFSGEEVVLHTVSGRTNWGADTYVEYTV